MLTLVLISTIGAWLGFANPIFHFPLAVLAFPLGLAWIGLRATTGKNAFKFGWFAGMLAATGCFYWMVIPVQIYGGLPWYVALPCPALLASAMGIYYGLFSFGVYRAGRRLSGIPLCILAGLSWASMEILMGSFLSGFPWMNLASAFSPWVIAIQGASVIGSFGLSAVLVALSVAILLYSTSGQTLRFAAGIIIVLLAFGVYRVNSFNENNPDYMISIVQGNIDQGMKWEPQYQVETIKKYVGLSLEAINRDKPQVVIWPETAMPFYLQDNTPYRKAIQILAKDSNTPIIIGSPAYQVTDMKTRNYVLYNRAWLMDINGRSFQSYDKEHLVPFGEYMPLKEWIPFEKLVQAIGDFAPGKENKPMVLDGVALGMLICYEGIFQELAQKQVEREATALVNISNDAWFADTSAPRQHLNLTILRAVEQGRWLVRGTNTGISAFIDPLGRIAKVGTQFQAESLSAKIAPRKEKTIFHKLFPWMTPAIYLLTILGFAWVALAPKEIKE